MIDKDGKVTTDSKLKTGYKYTYKLRYLISKPSCSTITSQRVSSSATITLAGAGNILKSSPPLTGKFYVKCWSDTGVEGKTSSIDVSGHSGHVSNALNAAEGCGLYDKYKIYSTGKYKNGISGHEYVIRFSGINANMKQFAIVRDSSSPAVAGTSVPTITSTTLHDFGTNLMYEPIPFEFVKTVETKPQFNLMVGDLPAACHGNCDYSFVASVGAITSYSLSGTTLTITGTSLPTTAAGIHSIVYAYSPCTVDKTSISATSTKCTLTKEKTSGAYTPEYKTS